MNKELFDSMQKQMNPSPEIRAALTEKLSQPAKKRPVPWRKYGAVAACAALVIGMYAVYQTGKPSDQPLISTLPLHSYVTVEGLGEILWTENTTTATGGDTGAPNTGDLPSSDLAPSGALPGGAYIGDAPCQEEAVDAYEKLMDHFGGNYPDWYGGAYIDDSGYLVVQLVEDKDPGDKTLELQVLDWTDSDHVIFGSCKYSLAHLKGLMDRLNALPDQDPEYREVMAGWGVDEEANRIDLTLTDVNDHRILLILAELDPDDDAIYVQVGQRVVADVGRDVREPAIIGEDPAVRHVMPGGVPVPDDEDLIADEPYYDGARYDVEELPEKLPKEEKRPANTVDSVPEEDSSTDSYDPNA